MSTGRLEAFSDGVFAIIITIMVLEFKVPKGHDLSSLRPMLPTFISYVLSFVLVANYWNNHHHLLQMADRVNGKILWANAHLLFWLSLTPVATSWMGENDSYPVPVAFYGVLQLGCGMAFLILTRALLMNHASESLLATVVGTGMKEKASVIIYLISLPLAFVNSWLAFFCYFTVATMWLIPDRRIEKVVKTRD
jgi:uncharacterized membrane protein